MKKTVALVILSVLLLIFCSISASAVAGYELEDKAAEPTIVLPTMIQMGINRQAGYFPAKDEHALDLTHSDK